MEKEISKMYKDRLVNIMGEINQMWQRPCPDKNELTSSHLYYIMGRSACVLDDSTSEWKKRTWFGLFSQVLYASEDIEIQTNLTLVLYLFQHNLYLDETRRFLYEFCCLQNGGAFGTSFTGERVRCWAMLCLFSCLQNSDWRQSVINVFATPWLPGPAQIQGEKEK